MVVATTTTTTSKSVLLKDLPFEPVFDEKDLETLSEWLVAAQHEFDGTANYAIMLGDKEIEEFVCQMCHASIAHACEEDSPIEQRPYLVASAIEWDRRGHRPEIVRPFFDWWFNESYMSKYLKPTNKDPDFAFNNGIILSANIPTILLQNILITSRHFYECGEHAFTTWTELVKDKGIDPMIAFICVFSNTFSMILPDTRAFVTSKSSHRSSPLLSLKGLVNAVKGRVENQTLFQKLTKQYLTSNDYHGGSALFYPQKGHGGSLVKEMFKRGFSLSDVQKEAIPNPFASSFGQQNDITSDNLTHEQFYSVGVPWVDSKVKEMITNER